MRNYLAMYRISGYHPERPDPYVDVARIEFSAMNDMIAVERANKRGSKLVEGLIDPKITLIRLLEIREVPIKTR